MKKILLLGVLFSVSLYSAKAVQAVNNRMQAVRMKEIQTYIKKFIQDLFKKEEFATEDANTSALAGDLQFNFSRYHIKNGEDAVEECVMNCNSYSEFISSVEELRKKEGVDGLKDFLYILQGYRDALISHIEGFSYINRTLGTVVSKLPSFGFDSIASIGWLSYFPLAFYGLETHVKNYHAAQSLLEKIDFKETINTFSQEKLISLKPDQIEHVAAFVKNQCNDNISRYNTWDLISGVARAVSISLLSIKFYELYLEKHGFFNSKRILIILNHFILFLSSKIEELEAQGSAIPS